MWPAHAAEVLVVAAPNQRIVPQIVSTLAERSGRTAGAGTARLSADVQLLRPGEGPDQLAQRVSSQLQNYRAVFATSIGLARAVQRENDRVPIVFLGQADPVQLCLADSMQRPGRNATGYMDYLPDDDSKMMESLVDAFPKLRTIYMMVAGSSYYVPDCGNGGPQAKPPAPPCVSGLRSFDQTLEWLQQTPATLRQAERLGVQVKFLLLCNVADFGRLVTLEPGRDDVGYVFALQALYLNHPDELLVQVALSKRPAIYGLRLFAKRGGLMSLEPILDASDDRAAIDMLLRVLDGRAPGTMPIQVPRGFKLTVNARAAAAQGLRPSLKSLRRADEVIVGEGR